MHISIQNYHYQNLKMCFSSHYQINYEQTKYSHDGLKQIIKFVTTIKLIQNFFGTTAKNFDKKTQQSKQQFSDYMSTSNKFITTRPCNRKRDKIIVKTSVCNEARPNSILNSTCYENIRTYSEVPLIIVL